MLDELGLTPEEELVYRALVGRPDSAAASLGVSPDKATALLDGLAARGLVTRSRHEDRYRVVDPGLALMTELLSRRDRLYRAELAVAELAAQHQAATRGRVAQGLVEIVEGTQEIARRFGQLQLGARECIDAFITDNNRVVTHEENHSEPIALGRGVSVRAVVDAHFLRQPNGVESVEHSLAGGADVRVVDQVPMKLIVTDRDVAMVPVGAGDHTTLLLHGPLVALAIALFESVWQRARPYRQQGGDVNPVDTRLLHLMLAGLTDEVIAHQMQLSARSVQRRIRALMDRAGVTTRIQLGWHARHHGWA
ncbi:hypothetical protein ONA91_20865 [Micromonospora sp. DR5-3]|uniref:hypothetical protein n=1 Tax=unclassified Micromonospora TaxID=2617518 RepID=UPI0011D39ED3|nr:MULTISPECIES: hypothetical protein [unclassified Micromonospora]MCW3816902.1 hypothetical protein [Micromonospora sp. DR5-3]TYC23403.1 hypothetical protein FXF52_15515 [Micromonospora sp. MP36]